MPAQWQDVGAVEDFPPGSITVIELERRSIGIVHTPSGLHAIRNECPHQSAPICRGVLTGTMLPSAPGTLEYGFDDEIIRCPWHGWEFFVDSGEAVFGISTRKLVTYAVEVRDGRVCVRIPSSAGRVAAPQS